jgi:hypothetical protein
MSKEKEDSPADRLLHEVNYRLKDSRDSVELSVLRSVLLRAGIVSITDGTNNNDLAVKLLEDKNKN